MPDLNEPRLDIRPPDYRKGQFFGGVPHSRVIIIATDATGRFLPLSGGLVMDAGPEDFTFPNEGFATWRGTYTFDGVLWVANYRWAVASAPDGVVNFTFSLTNGGNDDRIISDVQETRPDLSLPKTIEITDKQPEDDIGDVVKKYDIPEWADPLERWPSATLTTHF